LNYSADEFRKPHHGSDEAIITATESAYRYKKNLEEDEE
jgi:hypothetical protein